MTENDKDKETPEADIKIITKTDDTDAFIAMDEADEEQVLAEISGRSEAMDHYVYSFNDKYGNIITGLSLAGVREAARAMSLKGIDNPRLMQPTIPTESIVIEETKDHWRARATAVDQRSGFTWTGFVEQDKRRTKTVSDKETGEKTQEEVPIPFAYVIATSKAQRNAYRGLLPEHWIVEMIKQFLSQGKAKELESPDKGYMRRGKYSPSKTDEPLTLEEVYEQDPQYLGWAAENWTDSYGEAIRVFLKGKEEPKEEEGDFIVVGDSKYPANGVINQNWFDRLKALQKEAGMTHPHLVNHLKKHYDVQSMTELTFEQALTFGKHLKLEASKKEIKEVAKAALDVTEPEEADNAEYEPYTIPDEYIKRADDLGIEGFHLQEFVVENVGIDLPIEGAVSRMIDQLISRLEEGEDYAAMVKVFKEGIAALRETG